MTDSGKAIAFNDPNIDRIHAAAMAAKLDPRAFLELREIFGAVADSELFRMRFTDALGSLQQNGAGDSEALRRGPAWTSGNVQSIERRVRPNVA